MIDFIKKIKWGLIIGVLIFVVLEVYLLKISREREAKVERLETNLKVAQDSLRTTKAKDSSIEYNKLVYLAKDNKELKSLNDSLYKELRNTQGKVIVITKGDIVIQHDTIVAKAKGEIKDSIVYVYSGFDTTYTVGNFRNIRFESSYSLISGKAFSRITEDKIGFTAVVGLKQSSSGGYEIFVRPKYPNMSVVSLEGAIIEKNLFTPKTKTPLITLGANVGWTPITYDLGEKKGDINLNRLGITFGLNFNLGAFSK